MAWFSGIKNALSSLGKVLAGEAKKTAAPSTAATGAGLWSAIKRVVGIAPKPSARPKSAKPSAPAAPPQRPPRVVSSITGRIERELDAVIPEPIKAVFREVEKAAAPLAPSKAKAKAPSKAKAPLKAKAKAPRKPKGPAGAPPRKVTRFGRSNDPQDYARVAHAMVSGASAKSACDSFNVSYTGFKLYGA